MWVLWLAKSPAYIKMLTIPLTWQYWLTGYSIIEHTKKLTTLIRRHGMSANEITPNPGHNV